jgi:hypothetical protein
MSRLQVMKSTLGRGRQSLNSKCPTAADLCSWKVINMGGEKSRTIVILGKNYIKYLRSYKKNQWPGHILRHLVNLCWGSWNYESLRCLTSIILDLKITDLEQEQDIIPGVFQFLW